MAEIRAFRAFRFNPEKVAFDKVLTQPYDKITPAMQQRYYQQDPHNLIAVEKGRSFPEDSPGNNVYTRAAKSLREWIESGVLVQDAAPAIYVYAQEFGVPGGRGHKLRRGFIALSRLEDYDAGVVFRHEQTLSAPKADRLELLRHTRAQTGQLFMLYVDREKRIDRFLAEAMRQPAACEMRDEYEVLHRLWAITDSARIAEIVNAMASQKLVIADGHHRYETALMFRSECRTQLGGAAAPDAPHEFAMMTFVNAHAEGLVILPTHRVVSNVARFDFHRFRDSLRPYFDWYSYPFSTAEERAQALAGFRGDLAARGRERRAIGAYAGDGAFYLFLLRHDANLGALLPEVSPAQRQLDVALLHSSMLAQGLGISAEAVRAESHIRYEREMEAALTAVDRGDAQIAFLLNPVRISQMMELALAGEVLPQKSTDFYPKMLSGIAIYCID